MELQQPSAIAFDGEHRRSKMTIWHWNDRHHDWKLVVDYETVWVLMYSAAIVGSLLFALFSIAQNRPNPIP